MTTTLTVDDVLVDEARRLGEHETVQETVEAALRDYVERRKRLGILQLAGTIEYYPDYDIKGLREKKIP